MVAPDGVVCEAGLSVERGEFGGLRVSVQIIFRMSDNGHFYQSRANALMAMIRMHQ